MKEPKYKIYARDDEPFGWTYVGYSELFITNLCKLIYALFTYNFIKMETRK